MIKSEQALTRYLGYILGILFFFIIFLVIALVFLRYGFNTTIVGGNELVVILFIYTSALGAAAVVGRDEHIAITFFVDKLPGKLKKAVDILKLLLIAFLNGAMIKYSIPWISKTGGYTTAVLGIPRYYLQIIIPISCAIAVIYCLFQIIVRIHQKATTL